jgi:hypothetical protein
MTMIVAAVILIMKNSITGLKWLLICWVSITCFGVWWFNYDADRARDQGAIVIDADYVNSFNCTLLGIIGLVVGGSAWLYLKSKKKPEGQ